MIEMKEIESILKEIDKEDCDSKDGWWETSFGAEFGAKKLKELKEYISRESKDTGIKDIKCEPIYADNSIMECYVEGKKEYVYCTYVLEKMAYHFFFADRYPFTLNGFDSDKVVNLKIVDTIRKNKLGLIDGK